MKTTKKNNKTNHKFVTECLSCSEIIFVGRIPKIGSFINCEYCDSEFVITSITPAEIDWPEYDYDYDADSDDEELDYEEESDYEYADHEYDN